MPAFAYQALDAAGKTQRGVMQGDTPRAVRASLRERGLNPLEVEPAAAARAPFGKRGLSGAQLALFTRQLATLLKAGLPLDEALAALGEQDEDARAHALIANLRARVLEGSSLAAGMAEAPESFPEIFRASVAAGEQSGRLDEVLARLADYAEARDALQQKIQAALIYPILLTLIATLVVAALLVYVVPQIVGVFTQMHQSLPWPTRALLALSAFLKVWGVSLLALVAVAAIGGRLALTAENVRARFHVLLLRTPLLGRLVRASNTARCTRTLALLTASAVPLLDALGIAAQVMPNLPMRDAMRRAALKVREGAGFSRSLAESGWFPPVALRLIASGERAGELPRMLEEAAAQQQRELDRWTGALTSILGPLVILAVGAMVLFIVLAILLPIFDLNQMVK